jgi:hypothetical protein
LSGDHDSMLATQLATWPAIMMACYVDAIVGRLYATVPLRTEILPALRIA